LNNLRTIDASWLIIIPIDNLVISDEPPICGKFQVGDVQFMSRNKAESFLQPPNISAPLSDYKRSIVMDKHETLAIVQRQDTPANLLQIVFRDVREAVGILAATDAFYGTRRMMHGFNILGYSRVTQRIASFVGSTQPHFFFERSHDGGIMTWSLDREWHDNIDTTGLLQLFDAINDHNLDTAWRAQIRGASAFLGRSLMSHERTEAFLFDIFALETLLTRRGERNGRMLARRIKGIAGWHLKNHRPNWEQEIGDIFEVRCEAVHDADYGQLTMEHLLLADIYIKNVLLNVVLNRSTFTSKDALIATIDGWAGSELWPSDGSFNLRWIGSTTFNPDDLELPLW
jgi:hypothetical protein